MDRRYYLAKLAILIAAVALAVASTGMSGHATHVVNTASHYSAPAQVQAAAWHATMKAGRALACLLTHGFQVRL